MSGQQLPRISFPQDRLPERECPACGAPTLRAFYLAESGTADVLLAQCETCAFITNVAFSGSAEPLREDRTIAIDITAHLLAAEWIERFNLRGKTIIEVGCGQGEFLELICGMAGARGIGFDPFAHRDRSDRTEVTFIAAPFEAFADQVRGDFICCRHTLEYVARPLELISAIRTAAEQIPVAVEVTDFSRALATGAYRAISPDQVSYFTAPSLGRLFQRAGFEVQQTLATDDGQSILIHAVAEPFGGQKRDMPTLTELRGVSHFGRLATRALHQSADREAAGV